MVPINHSNSEFSPSNRWTASDSEGIADEGRSVSQIVEELAARDFECSPDRLERWSDAGLIEKAAAKPGRGSLRFYSAAARSRLHHIADIHVRFGLKKLSNAEIGFWLAADGYGSVPTGLVLENVETATDRFTALGLTIMADRAGDRYLIETAGPPTVEKVSNSIGKNIARLTLLGAQIGAQLFWRQTVSVFLTKLLLKSKYETVAEKIQWLLRSIGASSELAATWAPHVWTALLDVTPFFVAGKQNAFVRAVRANVNLANDESNRVAVHARMLYDLLLEAYPEMGAMAMARAMVPMLAGMVLHMEGNGSVAVIRQRLDANDVEPIRQDIATLRGLCDTVLSVLRGQPKKPS